MIKVVLLKNHPNTIPTLANIWHEVLGKIWVPDISVERVIARFADHLNDQDLPITFVNDLEIVTTSQKLRAGTFGRGIWETDLCATSVAGLDEIGISDSYALIYPNPAQDEFFIVQKSIQPIENVSMVDLNGKQLAIQLEEKTGMLLVRFDLPAGMYVLNYTVNGQVFSNKVSVK